MLTKAQFGQGLLVFNSCGGPNPDEVTIKVWYELLKELNPYCFQEAIVKLVRNEKNLGCINFVAEIIAKSELVERSLINRAEEIDCERLDMVELSKRGEDIRRLMIEAVDDGDRFKADKASKMMKGYIMDNPIALPLLGDSELNRFNQYCESVREQLEEDYKKRREQTKEKEKNSQNNQNKIRQLIKLGRKDSPWEKKLLGYNDARKQKGAS